MFPLKMLIKVYPCKYPNSIKFQAQGLTTDGVINQTDTKIGYRRDGPFCFPS